MTAPRHRRPWAGRGAAALAAAVAGTAAVSVASVVVSDAPAAPGEPASTETFYRTGQAPSTRALVCPDLGTAGRVPTQVDLARADSDGDVRATVVGTAGRGARGAATWEPPTGPVLTAAATRTRIAVPGSQTPAAPAAGTAGLSTLAGLPADDLKALRALRADEDRKALAALAAMPADARAAVAKLAAPPDLSSLAGLSPEAKAGLMRLAVSSARPVVLRGDGTRGLTATLTAPGGAAGPVRAACAPSTGTAWYAGPATTAGEDPLLFLANLGTEPARVAVSVFAPGRAVGTVELAVPAQATISERVAAVAPEAKATVVGVETRAGRVASWLVDRPSTGAAWEIAPVPATAAAGRALVVGPFAAPQGKGAATARLVLAAPAGDARARVRLVAASGTPVTPDGLDDVAVPGGEAVTVPLTLPRAEGVAVLVDATGQAPVVAGLGLPSGAAATATASGRAGPAASAWVAATPAPAGLARPPAAPVDVAPVPAGKAGALVLTAPGAAGTVRVDGHLVGVAAGRAVLVPLRSGYEGGSLTVESGPVAASELLGTPVGRGGALATVSSVLGLGPADPAGPAVVVADPAAAR